MTSPAPSGLSTGIRLLLVGVIVAALAGAAGLWYVFLRPSGPAAVLDPTAAPTRSAASAGPAASSAASSAASPVAASTAAGGAPAGGVAGTWTVRAGSDTFVGYRVQEQLASIGGNTAVGRTGTVTGSFTLEGTTVTAATFTATLTGLTSDERGRDGRVQDALNTRQFPTSTFVLSTPIALGSIPADGQEISATAKGKLTIRGVTRDAEFQLTAKLTGATLTIKASTQFAFADYSVPKPQAFAVLSIADTGTLETQLTLAKG